MKPRLIRALQRGGVTASLRTDLWGVWRAPDRRGRVIGTLSGADVDVMRLQDKLKPLGDGPATVLTWSGNTKVEPAASSVDPQVFISAQPAPASVLELILRKMTSPDSRDALRRACEQYRHDFEQANHPSAHVTMNWDRLGVEARPSPSSHQHGSLRSESYSTACRRLAQLSDRLSSADLFILDLTVIREMSRAKLAKTLGLRPAITQRLASGALRGLVEFYATQTSVSSRIGQPYL